ncbi:MAG TPA: hypothetical protein VNK95_15590 [Caldilineaceae bacterium]|nr:hypothetical protein [Caldilineaceae bacterium]
MSILNNTITLRLESVTCAQCGIVFGLQDAFLAMLRETGAGFCCPNGHSLRFGESTVDRLKKELAAAKRQSQQYERWYRAEQADHQHTRNRLRAVKGQLTKTRKRVAHGVCPCCNRYFKDLARHMAGQHPEFVQAAQADHGQ